MIRPLEGRRNTPRRRRVGMTPPNRAVLALDDLTLPVRLGVPDDERAAPQRVRISLRFAFPALPAACTSDDIAGTIDYGVLCRRLADHLAQGEFKTIEYLAHSCLDLVIQEITAPGHEPAVQGGAAIQGGAARRGTEATLSVRKYPAIDGLEGGASFTLTERI